MSDNTDQALYEAMLKRAGISYSVQPTEQAGTRPRQVPDGCLSVWTGDFGRSGEDDSQPYSGGYIGFCTETVFDPTGQLLASWAWE